MRLDHHKSEQYNHSGGSNSSWSHHMNITVIKGAGIHLYANGKARGILYRGNPDGGTIQSDETYYANHLLISAVKGEDGQDTIQASGGTGYLLRHSIWFPENAGKIYTLNFDRYRYRMSGDTDLLDIDIDGRLSSTCFAGIVQYNTSETLVDDNATRDINGSRIPSSGTLEIRSIDLITQLPRDTKAFETHNDQPGIEITVNGARQRYDSWRDITYNSNCAVMQEFIDRAIVK
jgi:hypothetical protein